MTSSKEELAENSKIPLKKWRQRHRILWVLGWLFAGLLGLVVIALVCLMIFANTQKGQDYIANKIGELTNHTVEVSGISGYFPNHLSVGQIELKDPKVGVWLSLKQTKLDWSLLALLHKEIHVDRLYAKEINVYNLPPPTEPVPEKSSSGSLPDMVVAANINDLQIDKLFVADKVAPINLSVGIKGKVAIENVLKVAGVQSLKDLSDIHLSLHLWELNQATDLQLSADIGDQNIDQSSLKINVKRQSDGLVERLLKMDQLTPLTLNVSLQGPFDKLQTKVNLSAAETQLKVSGDIDLIHSAMNIALEGHSPAMTLSPTVGWGGWNLDANLHGAFKSPAGSGKFELTDLAAGDAMVNKLLLKFKGEDLASLAQKNDKNSSPWVHLNLVADGLRIPGSQPKLLANSPLSLNVVYHPNEKNEPVDLQLNHQLIKATGRIFINPALHGSFDLYAPELASLAKAGNIDLKGSAVLNMAFALPKDSKNPIHIDLDGPLMITGGMPIAVQLIGKQGHIGLHAKVTRGEKQQVQLQSLTLIGKQINLDAKGSLIGEQVKALLSLDVKDLSAAAPMLKGKASAQVNLNGSLKDLAAQLKLSTMFSTTAKSGYALRPSQLELTANAQHLPSKPSAVIALSGSLDQTPLNIKLQAGLTEKEKQYYLKLEQMEWRGLKAVADVVLSKKSMFPVGTIKLDVARLSDFGRLVNQKIQGNIHLDIHSLPEKQSKLVVDLNSQLNMPQAKVGKLSLSGFIDHPIEKPNVNLKLQANQLQVPKVVQGNALMTASGGMEGLKLTLNGKFPSLLDAKGNVDTALILDLIKKKANIQKFTALIKGENIRLLAPLQADFGENMGVNRLRMSVAPSSAFPATIDIAGTVKPKLALTVSLQNITPALAKPFAPDLHAKGMINAQAQLKGSLEKPQGNIRINAQNMQLLTGSAASLPPAQLAALANLNGNAAKIDTKLQVGQKVNASVDGTVPLQPTGNIALRLNGNIDLSVANAILGASAQQVKGLINLAMQINGNMKAPAITGSVNLTRGSFRDYAQGVTIREIQAVILGQKDHIILQSFSAKAGDGTMNADGQIGVFQPGMPINLHFGMKNAKPLVSDLLTAVLDSDINIKGMVKTRIDVGGMVKIKHADINIPHSMARSVVPLKVIRPGEKIETTHSSTMGPEIGLDLTIKSAGQILVRGFGLFTDMAGSIHIGGVANAPQISGGFAMQNGHIDLAGISLDFTKGIIGFKGSNVDHKLDPSLDFEVKKTVEGNTVSLNITGYASSPKISLTSSPPLSQDRVLAMLLFGVDSQSLSTTQMAEIGVALATLGGEGSGFDPIGTVRKSLGLDRLSIGGGGTNSQGSTSGTSVSAGKYLAKGVYLGAKQSTGAAGTQAEVQIDITKRLKATATVGTGQDRSGFVTPDNDPGSSIGLLYKFDY